MKSPSIYKYILLLSCFFVSATTVFADGFYPSFIIPDSLKKDAYAVMREYSSEYVQTSKTNATQKVKKVVTILNSKGDGYANFIIGCDKFIELESFSAIIYDALGKEVKKIKKGDLIYSSISSGSLATDSYTMSYDIVHPSYPFTIEYNYSQKWKDGIIGYPAFIPNDGYHYAVEKASALIDVPADIEVRVKTNADFKIEATEIKGAKRYSISTQGLKAIPYEIKAVPFKELFPLVLLAPNTICYESFCGNLSDWQSFGIWINELLKGQDALAPNVVGQMHELTKEAKDAREKVRILFEYLQNNNRYESIQLGVGGYRPISAASTFKNRYGDCKGLSNLMMAMLKAVDIPSNYCVISTKEESLYKDYPNFNQANHVILMVPLAKDTIWLECTSSTIPFGFVHDGIAGHDALVITDEGGVICRLPEYAEAKNVTQSNVVINVKEDGSTTGNLSFVENLFCYDDVIGLLRSNDREKIVEYVNYNTGFPKIQFGEYSVTENRSSEPSVKFETKFEASEFVNKTGTRLFIPICPLRKPNFNVFTAAERKLDIYISRGYVDADTIVFNIPEGYTVESLPKPMTEETKFGAFKSKVEVKNSSITYTQDILIHKGRYNKDEYKDMREFYRKINAALKQKIVIKKE